MHALPITYTECEALFTRTDGLRSVLFCASTPGEGTSTLAYATAQRAAANGLKVLFVDFNTFRSFPRDVLRVPAGSWSLEKPVPSDAFFTRIGPNLTILPAPIERTFGISKRKAEDVSAFLERMQRDYDLIVGDGPSVTKVNGNGVSAPSLAAAFQAVMLVVAAAEVPKNLVTQAITTLADAEANLIGCILNDRDNPSLRVEINRQFQKLGKFGGILSRVFGPVLDRLHLTNERF